MAKAPVASGRQTYSRWDEAPGIVGIITLFILGGLSVFGGSRGASQATLIVLIGAICGYALGGYRGRLTDEWLAPRCGEGIKADDLAAITTAKSKEGHFLALSSVFIAVYLLFYWFAVKSFSSVSGSADNFPMSWEIVTITAVAIGSMSACAVRYAAFIRMTSLLKGSLDQDGTETRMVDALRRSVFRREQLFEPAGNIFVTLGITATFLGLAVALVKLDLIGLASNSASAGLTANGITGAPSDTSANSFAAVANSLAADDQAASRISDSEKVDKLKSFVGCMGLALGMSMLGVVSSIAAQWLRGHGPDVNTDELLLRAQRMLRRRGQKI